jgi:hypothetical protein
MNDSRNRNRFVFSVRTVIIVLSVSALSVGIFYAWLRQPYELRYEYPNGTLARRVLERLEFNPLKFKVTYVPIRLWEYYDNGEVCLEKSFIENKTNCWGKDGRETSVIDASFQLRRDYVKQGITKQISFRPAIPSWLRGSW